MCTDCGNDFHSWSEDQVALKNKREAVKERKNLQRLEKAAWFKSKGYWVTLYQKTAANEDKKITGF